MTMVFGVLQCLVSEVYTYFLVNPLTAILGSTVIVGYVFCLRLLKTRTTASTAIGAIPGAMPPLRAGQRPQTRSRLARGRFSRCCSCGSFRTSGNCVEYKEIMQGGYQEASGGRAKRPDHGGTDRVFRDNAGPCKLARSF